MFEQGTLRVFRFRGAPVLLHWSLALGLLAFGGIRFLPGFWIGFTVMILLHELGHAYLVKRLDHNVQAVVVHGFGGFCRWDGYASRLEHSVIAWGGVLAQGFLLLGTLAWVEVMGPATTPFGFYLQDAWIRSNLWIIGLNLLPIRPLDGAEAWQIFRAMRVESVSFGQILRRCLPLRFERRPKPPSDPTPSKSGASPPGSSASDNGAGKGEASSKPSTQAEAAIAEALEKIAREAGEARKKK
jgi:Zn-dependent protease